MTAEQILARAKARREQVGLKLVFFIADRPAGHQEFTCYASTPEAKANWLAQAAANGWERVA
jgi:hypothetical protein